MELVINISEHDKHIIDRHKEKMGYIEVPSEILNRLVDAVYKGKPTVEPQEWIPVKDGLPDKSQHCWITLEYIGSDTRIVHKEFFNKEKGKFNNQIYYETQENYKIVAWQEYIVPSPYRGE